MFLRPILKLHEAYLGPIMRSILQFHHRSGDETIDDKMQRNLVATASTQYVSMFLEMGNIFFLHNTLASKYNWLPTS